ncbi:4'-phosphopantetheinyl transferase [Lipingzhangella halophila]|uniref:4'-phosphopantetheinyl transferase n=1 Tax=Lipingzhangella halophila TaxID=1783352 RepID=A0A7W7RHJ8_9ACTN|nr:4'-phosphopantetheinyl transferase superfamily protein [Lipingzhangella halophila]MBB4932102.1 4'-phosphopantetheinyl transferase [Lipingzhangella halophila]
MTSAVPTTPLACDVWWADPAWASPSLLELLDDRERERHGRFRLSDDQNRFAVAHTLARLVCARAAGCEPGEVTFDLHCRGCARNPSGRRDPHGKPHPDGPARGLEISYSHSGERVVVALTRGVPVGVDVERVSAERDIEGVAEYALAASERAVLDAMPADARVEGFFGYWARKEAVLKATGDGLSAGLTTVRVSGPDQPAALTEWAGADGPPHAWLSDLDAGPGYRAALAALTPGPVALTIHDGAPLLEAAERRSSSRG